MDEYIKKSYAVDAVLDVYYDTPDINLSGEKFEAAIRKIQAADVAPVRHERWVKQDDYSCCSGCGQSIADECVPWFKFCPNCGAKIDLED